MNATGGLEACITKDNELGLAMDFRRRVSIKDLENSMAGPAEFRIGFLFGRPSQ